MNYKKLIGYAIDTNTISSKNVDTIEEAKEIINDLKRFEYFEGMTLIKKKIFTLYDYSKHKGISLKDFLSENN